MNTNLILAGVSVCGLVLPLSISAQSQLPPQIESPVVHPNRTVTFNVRAPMRGLTAAKHTFKIRAKKPAAVVKRIHLPK